MELYAIWKILHVIYPYVCILKLTCFNYIYTFIPLCIHCYRIQQHEQVTNCKFCLLADGFMHSNLHFTETTDFLF
jgi:hypothetical protein